MRVNVERTPVTLIRCGCFSCKFLLTYFFSDFWGLEETCNQPQDPSGHTVGVCAGPKEGLAASDFVELAQHHAGRGFHGTSRGELRPATGGFF